jgi:guanylate kinase
MAMVSHIRGHLVLIMAPMGSGKGSIVSYIQEKFQVTQTISCTTRAQRPQEVDGVDYCFISREAFEEKIAGGDFIEWAAFGGNLYGTPKSELMTRLQRGEVVLSEIEVQGVLQMIDYIPKTHRTIIYIDGGEWESLKQRALARAPISEADLALRYERYCEEIKSKDIADIVVSNHDGEFEQALAHIDTIMNDIITKIHT